MRVRMASLQASLVQRSGPKRSIMDLVRSVALNFFTPAASLTIWNIASDSSSLVTGSAMLASSRLDVYGTLEAQPGVPEVVDVLLGERDPGLLEEPGPADALDPLAHALELPGISGPDLHQVLHGVHNLGPAGRVVRQVGDGQLREHGGGPGIAHLAADPDGDAVVQSVGQRHGGTHGVTVPAEHAPLFDHLYRFLPVDPLGPDGSRGTRGHHAGDLTDLGKLLAVDLRRSAMDAQDGDVRAVNRPAHVE